MKILSRLLLVILSVVLVASTYGMYTGATYVGAFQHDAYYIIRSPWLHEVRDVSLFGVLFWCLIFLRGDALFARIGILSTIASIGMLAYKNYTQAH